MPLEEAGKFYHLPCNTLLRVDKVRDILKRVGDSTERMVPEGKITADRLIAFSDAVFAVIVTVMVLELKAPDQAAFSALWPLWPTAISYAVSYLFIAVIWINHHHLMRFAGPPTLGLIWINFVHLFLVSLLPFATAWIARTRLASSPVVFYAGLFVCIDIAYNVFEREVLARADTTQVPTRMRRLARRRSLVVLVSFTAAMLVAFVAPRAGFGLICGALILHLRPEVPGIRRPFSFRRRTQAAATAQKSDQTSQIDNDVKHKNGRSGASFPETL